MDVHHKIAYTFERSYKIGRRFPDKIDGWNMEIICILSEHSDYIYSDPEVLFFAAFFCVFYNNQFLLNFLKSLIERIRINRQATKQRLDAFLELVDHYGIEFTRKIGEQVNTRAYHSVLFTAFDQKLRVVYSKIIRKLSFIFLRNQDSKHLLLTQDFELIQESFKKRPAKLWLKEFPSANHI